jgi:hypothetical protein
MATCFKVVLPMLQMPYLVMAHTKGTQLGDQLNPNEVHQLRLAEARATREAIIRHIRKADDYCASGMPVHARRYLSEALKALGAR